MGLDPSVGDDPNNEFLMRADVAEAISAARCAKSTRPVRTSTAGYATSATSQLSKDKEANAADVSFTLCTTTSDVLTAVTVLAKYDYICLDCEGRSFGKVDGALSLLCIGTPVPATDQQIFIFDVPALLALPSSHARIALSTLLSNTSIIKVTFDGRGDCLEIRDFLHVETQPVLDLQLAEALARRGGNGKLMSLHFGPKFADKNAKLLEGIRCISGMDSCMRRHAPNVSLHKDESVKEMHRRGESHRWMDRPLPGNLLRYAATDIRAIAHLLDNFRSQQIVPKKNSPKMTKLLAQSARYVTRNGVQTRQSKHVPGEFSIFSGDRTLFFPVALSAPLVDLLACRTCGARLPLACFQVENEQRRIECRACVAWMEAPFVGRDKRDMVTVPADLRVSDDWVEI